jgi:hypothetical protein
MHMEEIEKPSYGVDAELDALRYHLSAISGMVFQNDQRHPIDQVIAEAHHIGTKEAIRNAIDAFYNLNGYQLDKLMGGWSVAKDRPSLAHVIRGVEPTRAVHVEYSQGRVLGSNAFHATDTMAPVSLYIHEGTTREVMTRGLLQILAFLLEEGQYEELIREVPEDAEDERRGKGD